ncbi:MAG: hypothetical protein LUD17_11070 [Bacteroidales bacterium]|nr:hypothetical protein [Bacteroidales bacterium]
MKTKPIIFATALTVVALCYGKEVETVDDYATLLQNCQTVLSLQSEIDSLNNDIAQLELQILQSKQNWAQTCHKVLASPNVTKADVESLLSMTFQEWDGEELYAELTERKNQFDGRVDETPVSKTPAIPKPQKKTVTPPSADVAPAGAEVPPPSNKKGGKSKTKKETVVEEQPTPPEEVQPAPEVVKENPKVEEEKKKEPEASKDGDEIKETKTQDAGDIVRQKSKQGNN